MADGKRRYKSDRKDYKISVKLSEKDMDILNEAVRKSGKTVSEYVRELIRLGGNVDFKYPEDRARVIRIFSGIANNINQAVSLIMVRKMCCLSCTITRRGILLRSLRLWRVWIG